MTDKEINLLTTTKYFVIMSEKTKDVYIDENGAAYAFEMLDDCNDFTQKHPGTYRDKSSRALTTKNFFEYIYKLGANNFEFKPLNKPSIRTGIAVEFANEKLVYYNHQTVNRVNNLVETKKKKYLAEMVTMPFFFPVQMTERSYGKQPVINYCRAIISNEKLSLCFSTLEKFNKWNKTQGEKWSPYACRLKDSMSFWGQKKIMIDTSIILKRGELRKINEK